MARKRPVKGKAPERRPLVWLKGEIKTPPFTLHPGRGGKRRGCCYAFCKKERR